MSNKIFWSERAKNDYRGILIYFNQNRTSKELAKFTEKIERNLAALSSNPEMGTMSKKKSIRRLVISKQTSIYYKIFHGDIYLVALFDNRQNPEKLRSL